jgi:hypothetical protein
LDFDLAFFKKEFIDIDYLKDDGTPSPSYSKHNPVAFENLEH